MLYVTKNSIKNSHDNILNLLDNINDVIELTNINDNNNNNNTEYIENILIEFSITKEQYNTIKLKTKTWYNKLFKTINILFTSAIQLETENTNANTNTNLNTNINIKITKIIALTFKTMIINEYVSGAHSASSINSANTNTNTNANANANAIYEYLCYLICEKYAINYTNIQLQHPTQVSIPKPVQVSIPNPIQISIPNPIDEAKKLADATAKAAQDAANAAAAETKRLADAAAAETKRVAHPFGRS